MRKELWFLTCLLSGLLVISGCGEESDDGNVDVNVEIKPSPEPKSNPDADKENDVIEEVAQEKGEEALPPEVDGENPFKKPAKPEDVTFKEFFKTLKLPELVATIGDEKITSQDVYNDVLAQLKTQFPGFTEDKPLHPMLSVQLSSNIHIVVDSIVSRKILLSLAEKDGIKPSPDMITARFDEYVKNMSPVEKKMVEAQMNAQGTSLEKTRKDAIADVNAQEGLAIDKWISEKIIPEIKVDDAAVKKYYEENKANFKENAKVKVAHILIMPERGTPDLAEKSAEEKKAFAENAELKAKNEINAIHEKLKAGEDFAKLAKEKSSCPSKNREGELPEFDSQGRFPGGAMDSIFTEASFKLKPGELSEPVKTPFGYHLIKCLERKEEAYMPFEDVSEDLKQSMKKKQLVEKVKTLVDAEKEKKKVVVFFKEKEEKPEK